MAQVFACSVRSKDNLNLDPTRFKVVVAVHRTDGSLLTEADIEAARAALAPLAAPEAAPLKAPNPLDVLAGKATGTDG